MAVVTEPVQARSRATLERLLDATESLLGRKRFEDIEVDEIVRRARSSVGSFYARFDGKEGLLPPLYDRYSARLRDALIEMRDDPAWASLDLRETCERLAQLLVDRFRQNAGLLRAMVLHARTQRRVLSPEQQAERAELMRIPVMLLLRHRQHMPGTSPEQRASLAFFAANAAVREIVLFGNAPHAASLSMTDDMLSQFAASLLLAYLTSTEIP